MNFISIPCEILVKILRLVSTKDILNIRSICRVLNKVSDQLIKNLLSAYSFYNIVKYIRPIKFYTYGYDFFRHTNFSFLDIGVVSVPINIDTLIPSINEKLLYHTHIPKINNDEWPNYINTIKNNSMDSLFINKDYVHYIENGMLYTTNIATINSDVGIFGKILIIVPSIYTGVIHINNWDNIYEEIESLSSGHNNQYRYITCYGNFSIEIRIHTGSVFILLYDLVYEDKMSIPPKPGNTKNLECLYNFIKDIEYNKNYICPLLSFEIPTYNKIYKQIVNELSLQYPNIYSYDRDNSIIIIPSNHIKYLNVEEINTNTDVITGRFFIYNKLYIKQSTLTKEEAENSFDIIFSVYNIDEKGVILDHLIKLFTLLDDNNIIYFLFTKLITKNLFSYIEVLFIFNEYLCRTIIDINILTFWTKNVYTWFNFSRSVEKCRIILSHFFNICEKNYFIETSAQINHTEIENFFTLYIITFNHKKSIELINNFFSNYIKKKMTFFSDSKKIKKIICKLYKENNKGEKEQEALFYLLNRIIEHETNVVNNYIYNFNLRPDCCESCSKVVDYLNNSNEIECFIEYAKNAKHIESKLKKITGLHLEYITESKPYTLRILKKGTVEHKLRKYITIYTKLLYSLHVSQISYSLNKLTKSIKFIINKTNDSNYDNIGPSFC
jgi:hypothetical protein